MPRPIIASLTEEQEAMLPIYREKWRPIAISTEPIDRAKVAAVIKAAYLVCDYPEPEIIFYSSPFRAIQDIVAIGNFQAYLGRSINIKFIKRVLDHVRCGIMQQLEYDLFNSLRDRIHFP